MKRNIILIISIFFLFIPFVNAVEINNISVDATVKNDGSLDVVENVNYPPQKSGIYNFVFFNVENVDISDFSLTDNFGTTYIQVDRLEEDKAFFYTMDDQGYKKIVNFNVVQENTTFTFKYNLSNISLKFNDGSYGLDWFVFSRVGQNNIGNLNVNIKFENPELINKIKKIDLAGLGESKYLIEEDYIHFSYINIDSTKSLRFICDFENDVSFSRAVSIDKPYSEFSDDIINGRDFTAIFYAYSTKNLIRVFIVVLVLGVIILIASFLKVRYGTHDEYYGMEIKDKKSVDKVHDVPYYDSVPCQGDLYKVSFVGGFFKLLKNKSDLLGAVLFKMYLNDNIELIPGKNGRCIKLRNDMRIDSSLDQDLYNILLEASDMKVISSANFKKFAKDHYIRIMTWYNMSYSDSITDEFNRGHVTRGNKIGKTTKLIYDENFVDYGNKIIGMKKYLLDFNNVPRKTRLSEETYKLLLMCAEVLGIGKQVADEILSKNPNNVYAKKLQDFQSVEPVFSEIYGIALGAYRQTVKNNEIYNYDEMKNTSLTDSSNVLVIKRV